jgi:hypothetical protein
MSQIYTSEQGARLLTRRYRALLDSWPAPHEQVRIPDP